jgi:NAD+ diphosphatase
MDVRRLFATLDSQQAATLAYARGILRWHRHQRFCGACGAPTQSQSGGLLARHRGAAAGAYATLAGFVDLGECLEDAVRREVAEETGVRVGEVSYQGSQAWPFPAGLMIGFRARAVSAAISVDPAELDEAGWFSPAELSALVAEHPGNGDSIEEFLIGNWLDEHR